jgi:glutathione S-transferase
MMILRSAPPSPFGRKVSIAVSVLGFDAEVKTEPGDPTDPRDSVRLQNPLGKIPVLIVEDGTAFYDSRVILEYLDDRAGGGKIIPRAGGERFAALAMQALCDGILDASILAVYESRWRAPEHQERKWLEHQAGKVTRALGVLNEAPPRLAGVPHVGQIALACALGYRDLRFSSTWRADFPRLAAWLEDFAVRVPSFAATAIKP